MSLGRSICIQLQFVLAAVVVEMSVAHMLKLHLCFMKVSVPVASRADESILLCCFECC